MKLLFPEKDGIDADAWALGTNPCVVVSASRLQPNGAERLFQRLVYLVALWLLVILSSGCTAALVTGRISPEHFQFNTTVPHTEPGKSGGWRVACVHAEIKNGDTKEAYNCILGVEMPIENIDGPISTRLAQRISADCANEAAYAVLSAMTTSPPLPLYTLCMSVREGFRLRLNAAIPGSRVKSSCDSVAKPVVFGVPLPSLDQPNPS